MLRFKSLSAEKVCNGIRASHEYSGQCQRRLLFAALCSKGTGDNSEIILGPRLKDGLLGLYGLREALRATSPVLTPVCLMSVYQDTRGGDDPLLRRKAVAWLLCFLPARVHQASFQEHFHLNLKGAKKSSPSLYRGGHEGPELKPAQGGVGTHKF